ncbi:MAG: glycosyltransferase family 2 protein [Thermodesulfobacteriota bacterium]|nr:glycosyltransferase family 2 protein [Thermodesulfobacteriota bacterium]
MTTPYISVFIVNYNTSGLLEQCLRSIFNTRGTHSVEVFVADNASTDGSFDMVKQLFPEVSITGYGRNIGYAKAINPLLRKANGQFYLLLHPDVELLPDTLRYMMDFFERRPDAGIVGANLYYPDGTPNPCEILFPGFGNDLLCFALRLLRRLPGGEKLVGDYNPAEWSHRTTARVNWVWNACMMIRKEVLERIGFLDEDFYVWYGDWDLCKRAADVGWGVYYVHRATALHHERQSFARQEINQQEVLYKIDGWHSAPLQIRDRCVFLKKHASQFSLLGVKVVGVVENAFRLCFILVASLSRRGTFKEASFQIGMCVQTIQAILTA